MHTQPRTGPIFKIVIHTNEGPEGENTAEGLKNYLLNNGPSGGGYQVTFDDHHTVQVQPDSIVCYANGGVNHESVDGCIVGYAAQTPEEWADAFDLGAIEQAAQWTAQECKTYGIPAVRMSPAQVATYGWKGVCGHGDVTAAGFSGTEGHTDPGPNFPWDRFLARVNQILTPAPVVSPAEKARLVAIDDWRHRVHHTPLKYGDQNHDVAILINALRRKHFLRWWVRGDKYGKMCRTGVVKFKNTVPALASQPAPLKGEVFGGDAADALVGLG